MGKPLEKFCPIVFALCGMALACLKGFQLAPFISILDNAITVISILIGFMGALAGILLSIDSAAIKYLKRIGQFSVIFSYIQNALAISFVFVLFSLFLQFQNELMLESTTWSFIWIGMGAYALMSSFRALYVSTRLLRIVAEAE